MWLTFFRPLRHCCCYTWGFQQHDEMIKEKRKKVHFSPHKWFTQQQHFQGSSEYDKLLLLLYFMSITHNSSVYVGNLFSGPGLLQSSMNISITKFIRKRKKKRTHFILWTTYTHTQTHTHTIFMRFLLYVSESFFFLRQTGKAKLYMKNRLCQANTLDAFFLTRPDKCGQKAHDVVRI